MEDDLLPNTCIKCSRVFNKKHGNIYCEDCLSQKTDIVQSKGPSKIKEEVKEAYCSICLERSKSEVKVFRSDCIKNGHPVQEDLYSHRSISYTDPFKDEREINKKVSERVIIKADLIKRPSQIEPAKANI
jgi:hypothetical protein